MKVFVVLLSLIFTTTLNAQTKESRTQKFGYRDMSILSFTGANAAYLGKTISLVASEGGLISSPGTSVAFRTFLIGSKVIGITGAATAGYFIGNMIVKADSAYLNGTIVDAAGKVLEPAFFATYKIQEQFK